MNCAMHGGKDYESPMNKRVTTYLPEGIYELLEEWAVKEKRSISNLTAFLVERAVREHYEDRDDDKNGTPAAPVTGGKAKRGKGGEE